jgi:hypothetical protein
MVGQWTFERHLPPQARTVPRRLRAAPALHRRPARHGPIQRAPAMPTLAHVPHPFQFVGMGSKLRASRPTYTANLGTLIAANIPVRAECRKCGQFEDVDLVELAAKVGADLDLWNRHPTCRMAEGCDGRVTFMFRGRGMFENMRDLRLVTCCSPTFVGLNACSRKRSNLLLGQLPLRSPYDLHVHNSTRPRQGRVVRLFRVYEVQ